MFRATPSHRWAFGLLMLALSAWGAYVAIGTSRFDWNPLKGVIVLGCVIAFLGLWSVLLLFGRGHAATRPTAGGTDVRQRDGVPSGWSKSCLTSLVLVLFGASLLGLSEADVLTSTPRGVELSAWLAVWSIVAAIILAMIGLSEPRPRRGKWLAILTLVATVCLLVVWIWFHSVVEPRSTQQTRPDGNSPRAALAIESGYGK